VDYEIDQTRTRFILDRSYSTIIPFSIVGMPNMPYVYAMDFIDVLKKKHASRGYRKMVRFNFSGR
jgi:hypothetical protein